MGEKGWGVGGEGAGKVAVTFLVVRHVSRLSPSLFLLFRETQTLYTSVGGEGRVGGDNKGVERYARCQSAGRVSVARSVENENEAFNLPYDEISSLVEGIHGFQVIYIHVLSTIVISFEGYTSAEGKGRGRDRQHASRPWKSSSCASTRASAAALYYVSSQ